MQRLQVSDSCQTNVLQFLAWLAAVSHCRHECDFEFHDPAGAQLAAPLSDLVLVLLLPTRL